jgi:AcrR family transcriptional regulator
MARPKSEDKRRAILASAIKVFAKEGLRAPTSAISKAAGVAEGTLFTYFLTKDNLVNAVYHDIKLELATATLSSYPAKDDVRARMHHAWDRFVEWGASHPEAYGVLRQIEVWPGLKVEPSEAEVALHAELAAIESSFREQHLVQDFSPEFVQAAIDALAQMTIELMRRNPPRSAQYRSAGFNLLWAGISPPSLKSAQL